MEWIPRYGVAVGVTVAFKGGRFWNTVGVRRVVLASFGNVVKRSIFLFRISSKEKNNQAIYSIMRFPLFFFLYQ